jgi:hypothetical protein
LRPAHCPLKDYYGALRRYVSERGGYLVGNPGDTAATNWQLAYVDQVVTFEGNDADYSSCSAPAWVSQAQPAQKTERPNPYATLPSYWTEELAGC